LFYFDNALNIGSIQSFKRSAVVFLPGRRDPSFRRPHGCRAQPTGNGGLATQALFHWSVELSLRILNFEITFGTDSSCAVASHMSILSRAHSLVIVTKT